MKKFSEMSQSEINDMSKEEFAKVSPFDKKSCSDCGHLKEVLSLWCTNERAIKVRGTRIPGCIKCPYWKPDWNYIPEEYHTAEYGYVPKLERIIEKPKSRIKSWLKKIGL